MKRRTIRITLALCMLLVLACRIADRRAAAQEEAAAQPEADTSAEDTGTGMAAVAAEGLIFFDHFEAGTERWELMDGWATTQVEEHTFLVGSANGIAFVKGGGDWVNYLLRGRLRVESGVAALSAYLSSEGRYLLVSSADGLYLARESFSDGSLTPLAMTDAPAMNTWHWFGLGIDNGHLQVGVDGELVLDVTDPDPLPAGTVGVGVGVDSQVEVNYIIVSDIAGMMRTDVDVAQVTDFTLPEDVTIEALDEGFAQAVEDNADVDVDGQVALPSEEELAEIMQAQEPIVAVEAPEMVFATAEPPPEAVEAPEVVFATAEMPEEEPQLLCDLSVQSVSIPKPWKVNQPLNVTVTVTNKGDNISPLFNVEWYPASDGVVGGSWEVLPLAPGGSVPLQVTYPGYPQAGEVTWLAQIDREGEVAESNRGNNTRSGTMTIEAAE